MYTKFRITKLASLRILSLLVLSFFGLILTTLFVGVLDRLPKFDATLWLVMLQDVLAFILPAILGALIFYHRPWQQLCVNKAPSFSAIIIVICVYVASTPALNWIVEWNKGLHLPQSMAAVEQYMRDAETAAQLMTDMLLNETMVLPMLAVLFVVGIMAGVSEEFFFRGGMLRMLNNDGNSHVAVWTIAAVFSAMHVQFFGFFPRLLLGAWLGYLLVWTRSLWVPIIAHALNNSMVVLVSWLANIGLVNRDSFEHFGVPQDGSFPLLALASAVATIALAVFARSVFTRNESSGE